MKTITLALKRDFHMAWVIFAIVWYVLSGGRLFKDTMDKLDPEGVNDDD